MKLLYKIAGVITAAAALINISPPRSLAEDRELKIPDHYETGSSSASSSIDIGNTESESVNDFDMINGSAPQ